MGEAFEDRVVKYLENRADFKQVTHNGTEHTHGSFMDDLRKDNSKSAIALRFKPDISAIHKSIGLCYADAKRALTMEKTAYNNYMREVEVNEETIFIFIERTVRYQNEAYWQRVEKIEFIDSQMIVDGFAPQDRFPIDDDGWIAPRLNGSRAGNGSGTPYREVNIDSFIQIYDFYRVSEL